MININNSPDFAAGIKIISSQSHQALHDFLSYQSLSAEVLQAMASFATEHDVEKLKLCLDAGADPNGHATSMPSLLSMAIYWDEPDNVEFLISRGATVNYHADMTYQASWGGGLQGYIGPGWKSEHEEIRFKGWTPLHLAVYACRLSIVEHLLTARADASARSDEGTTPLHIACCLPTRYSRSDVWSLVNALLAAGSSVNTVGDMRQLVALARGKPLGEPKPDWTPGGVAMYFEESRYLVGLLLAAGGVVSTG